MPPCTDESVGYFGTNASDFPASIRRRRQPDLKLLSRLCLESLSSMETMLALRRQKREPRAAAVEEVPIPEPIDDEVLLEVHYCGLCGSDLHAWLNHAGYESVLPQVTFGHELAGTVVKTGPSVSQWKVGQPGVMMAIQSCFEPSCHDCQSSQPQLCPQRYVQGLHRDGGMARYVTIREKYLLHLPEGQDLLAAALIEPLSVAVHCIEDCSSIGQGDRVVVCGPGIIGMFCALVARHRGADVVLTGTSEDEDHRLSAARKIGFETLTVGEGRPSLAGQAKAHFGTEPDTVVEASGASAALADAPDVVRPDGSIVVVALYGFPVTLNATTMVRKQLKLQACYASTPANYTRAMELLNQGVIPVAALTKVYPLESGLQAFADAEAKEVMKPVLRCIPYL